MSPRASRGGPSRGGSVSSLPARPTGAAPAPHDRVPRPAPCPERGAPALTLVELLVALSLLSLVLTLVFGSFFQISTGASGLQDELSEQQELRLLLKLVADDLQTARYLPNAAQAHLPTGLVARYQIMGRGEVTEINFHAATRARFYRLRPAALDPLLHEVGYSVLKQGETERFILQRREQFYLDSDLERGGITVELARDVELFKVEFLKASTGLSAPTEDWDKEWDSSQRPDGQRMPVAMRLTIGRAAKNGRHLQNTLEFNLESVLKANR